MYSGRSGRLNWARIFSTKLKIPYGTYAFGRYMDEVFPSHQKNKYSFGEMLDTLENPAVFLSISSSFYPTQREIDIMLEKAAEGSTFLIASDGISGVITDTLQLSENYLADYYANNDHEKKFLFSIREFFVSDTVEIRMVNPDFRKHSKSIIRKSDQLFHFQAYDSARALKIAEDSEQNAIIIRIPHGDGNIILCSTPFLFSNVYFLHGENEVFIRQLLSWLPQKQLYWTEFYELGRGISDSPMRFILSEQSLKFSLYTLLSSLVLFVFFEAKRKQRIIPVVKPPENTTLQFVRTIGNLYYDKSSNKAIAEKRFLFFQEQIRNRYFLNIHSDDKDFLDKLFRKSGVQKDILNELMKMIEYIGSKEEITSGELNEFSKILDKFYKQAY